MKHTKKLQLLLVMLCLLSLSVEAAKKRQRLPSASAYPYPSAFPKANDVQLYPKTFDVWMRQADEGEFRHFKRLLFPQCPNTYESRLIEQQLIRCEEVRPTTCVNENTLVATMAAAYGFMEDGSFKIYENICQACSDIRITAYIEFETQRKKIRDLLMLQDKAIWKVPKFDANVCPEIRELEETCLKDGDTVCGVQLDGTRNYYQNKCFACADTRVVKFYEEECWRIPYHETDPATDTETCLIDMKEVSEIYNTNLHRRQICIPDPTLSCTEKDQEVCAINQNGQFDTFENKCTACADATNIAIIQKNCTEIPQDIYYCPYIRKLTNCPQNIQPVCGQYLFECDGYNCQKTFSNGCEACSNLNIDHYTNGPCEWIFDKEDGEEVKELLLEQGFKDGEIEACEHDIIDHFRDVDNWWKGNRFCDGEQGEGEYGHGDGENCFFWCGGDWDDGEFCNGEGEGNGEGWGEDGEGEDINSLYGFKIGGKGVSEEDITINLAINLSYYLDSMIRNLVARKAFMHKDLNVMMAYLNRLDPKMAARYAIRIASARAKLMRAMMKANLAPSVARAFDEQLKAAQNMQDKANSVKRILSVSKYEQFSNEYFGDQGDDARKVTRKHFANEQRRSLRRRLDA